MSPQTVSAAAAHRRARTCYDHLAGQLGVAILAGLVECGALTRASEGTGVAPYALGPQAEPIFQRLGVDLPELVARSPRCSRPSTARPLLRLCLDGTERRHHLAGMLGAAVLTGAEAAGWVIRRPGERAVEITHPGQRAFREILRVRL